MNLITRRWDVLCFWKKAFYRLQFGKGCRLPASVRWRDNFHIYLEPGAALTVGENCFFNNDCSLNVRKEVRIGADCLFGEGVRVYDHNHVFKNLPAPFRKQGFREARVVIGSNVWLGANAVVLPGAEIGDNCVIAAGCVVSGPVPAGTLVRLGGVSERIVPRAGR